MAMGNGGSFDHGGNTEWISFLFIGNPKVLVQEKFGKNTHRPKYNCSQK
jgi:hypothetical protein